LSPAYAARTLAGMNSAPLGFFDSGVGGLTVVRAVKELLPGENILYLGDTARMPYGSKSPETIRRFADEDVRFLLAHGVKAVVLACNTVTAYALARLREQYRVPIFGVEAAIADTKAQRIGIIGTRGTINSHAYQHALAQCRTGLVIHGQATPLLVHLIEENWIDHPATRQILREYLDPLVAKGIDTLLLACVHYPLLVPVLQDLLPPGVRLVDPATTCAEHLKRELTRFELLAPDVRPGKLDLYLTDLSPQFEQLAQQFLQAPPGRIRHAVLAG
jgi:glutamate racemase